MGKEPQLCMGGEPAPESVTAEWVWSLDLDWGGKAGTRDLRGPVSPTKELNLVTGAAGRHGWAQGKGTPSSVHGPCRLLVEADEGRGRALWWSPGGPAGGYGGPASVEKRDRLSTQVKTLGRTGGPTLSPAYSSQSHHPQGPMVSFGFSESLSPSLFLPLPLSWAPWTVVSVLCSRRSHVCASA